MSSIAPHRTCSCGDCPTCRHREYIKARYHRLKAQGNPVRASEFAARVSSNGDPNACVEWEGGYHIQGYGVFRSRLAHRLSYELFVGDIPEGLLVCHHCDNRRCVNPAHLFVGTYLDNNRDMFAKGRNRNSPPFGEKHPKAILTNEQVLAIRQAREEGRPVREIAIEFATAESNVSAIVSRRAWRHL